ncbi:hypothetical protein [Gallaecimonas xiamenensis]|uniref:Uncharacterized protein n=1 Tax=Gallaecimonas xiamenensis 3-C-1 TaxID=745411 RepID=K2JL45_9GAMM|nr:hypothetical protein [Gallaecimonas xiamenensis]EKE75137.1 hypothetical protein B3C1_07671 [Gallaecimonas xiamenensis 3-C-1]
MKRIFTHLLTLVLGAALAFLWFANQGTTAPVPVAETGSQPAPAAPVAKAEAAPLAASAANIGQSAPKPESQPAAAPEEGEPIGSLNDPKLLARLKAMGIDTQTVPPQMQNYRDLEDFQKDFRAFTDNRVVDEAGQANEAAIWEQMASLQQKVAVDLQDLACGDSRCLLSLKVADGDDVGKVTDLLFGGLAKQRGPSWFTTTTYTSVANSGEPVVLLIERVKQAPAPDRQAGGSH